MGCLDAKHDHWVQFRHSRLASQMVRRSHSTRRLIQAPKFLSLLTTLWFFFSFKDLQSSTSWRREWILQVCHNWSGTRPSHIALVDIALHTCIHLTQFLVLLVLQRHVLVASKILRHFEAHASHQIDDDCKWRAEERDWNWHPSMDPFGISIRTFHSQRRGWRLKLVVEIFFKQLDFQQWHSSSSSSCWAFVDSRKNGWEASPTIFLLIAFFAMKSSARAD